MSDLSFTDLESVSELSEISSVSTCSSPSSISSVSNISSSIESSSLAPSGSSSSRASSSVSSVDTHPLESVQHSQSHLRMDESDNQSNASGDEARNQSNSSGGEATSPSVVRSMTIDVARMLDEIGSINRYCEDIAAQIGSDILPTTSTPTVVRGARRRLDVTPVEVIDLSNLEFVAPTRPPPNRAPAAVIDLCTPDRSQLGRPTALGRRRNSPQSTSNAAIVEVDDGPSPPKRDCAALDHSQEDAYKCPVCLECVRRREPVTTKCGHVFCKSCLIAAISSFHKCPMCNKKLTQRQFTRIFL